MEVQREEKPSTSMPESFGPLDGPREPPKAEEKGEGSSGLGIPQFAVGALSLILAGVFLITSGPGGGGPSSPPAEVKVGSSSLNSFL